MATYTGSPNALASSAGVDAGAGQLRGLGLGRRGADERLLARDVPAPDLHLLDLLGRGDDRPEAQQVGALAQEQRLGLLALRCGRVLRRLRRAELELAVLDGHLVPDLAGQAVEELPVGDPALGDVVEDRRRGVDRADRQPGPLRDLLGHVRRGDLRVGLGAAAAEEPVRGVVAADDGERPGRVELRLQRGDLGGDQRFRRRRRLAGRRDHELRADLEVRLGEHGAVGVAEPQDHQVGQVQAVVDVRGHEQRLEVGRQRRPVDRDREGVADLRLRHVTPRP